MEGGGTAGYFGGWSRLAFLLAALGAVLHGRMAAPPAPDQEAEARRA